MKPVSVIPSQAELLALLDQAQEDDLLLQLADGREFILSMVDDFDLEIARTRQNEKLMAFLDERAKEAATIPLEEVERELGLK
jgi:hypothetical protein